MQLRFLADMNLSPLTVEALQREGYEVVRVSGLLPANAPDGDVLRLAQTEGMVIITQDLDFSALIALSGNQRPSLLTLRLSNTSPDVVTQRLKQVLPRIETELQEGCAVTVDDDLVRLRRLPIQ